ncbi:hypothetical protein J3B02_006079, partial [Coemansia erecta]
MSNPSSPSPKRARMNSAESIQYSSLQGANSKKVIYPAPTLEQFDLEQYLDEYSGISKIKRA